jgi:hypothetical protein
MTLLHDEPYRFLAPTHQKPDQVIAAKSEIEVIVPGTNGQKKGYADVYAYTVKPVPGQNTFRWQYQDPENAFRLTNWATGLTVTVSANPSLATLYPSLSPHLALARPC